MKKKIGKTVMNYIPAVLAVILLIVIVFTPRYGLISFVKLHMKKNRYEKDLREIKARIILMQNKLNRLETDREYIERIVREETGMIKKGEKILRKGD
ncbi:MAG: septum formation initiator family protein [bacterium]